MTRDNLAQRRKIDDVSCLFCSWRNHPSPVFECSRQTDVGTVCGSDYVSVGKFMA